MLFYISKSPRAGGDEKKVRKWMGVVLVLLLVLVVVALLLVFRIVQFCNKNFSYGINMHQIRIFVLYTVILCVLLRF